MNHRSQSRARSSALRPFKVMSFLSKGFAKVEGWRATLKRWRASSLCGWAWRCRLKDALLLGCVTVGWLSPLERVEAHHGLDFLLVQDAFVPAPGKGVLYGGFDWTRYDGVDSYYSEPGVMVGLLPGLAFGMGAETGDVGNGWEVYGLAPYLQMQLLPAEWSKRVRVALRVGYEVSVTPYSSTAVVPVTRFETLREVETVVVAAPQAGRRRGNAGGGGGGGNPQPCDPNAGPDAVCPPSQGGRKAGRHAGHGPPPAARRNTAGTTVQRSTTRSTVREITTYEEVEIQQRVEGFSARLMFEADLTGADRVVFNLVHFDAHGEQPAWGYAVGLRHAFHHDLAMSLEALGNLNQEDFHQAVIAAHYAPVHWGLIKLGAAFGLTDETPDLSLIAGFVIRF